MRALRAICVLATLFAMVPCCTADDRSFEWEFEEISDAYQQRFTFLLEERAPRKELRALGEWRRSRFRELVGRAQGLQLGAKDALAVAKSAEFLRDWNLSSSFAKRAISLDESSFDGYLVLVRGSLNIGQIDSAIASVQTATTACGKDAPLYILHYMLYRSCSAVERPDAFEHLNLLFEDGAHRLTSSRDAVMLMMQELPAYFDAYSQLDARNAGAENLVRLRDDAVRGISFLTDSGQRQAALAQILLLFRFACECTRLAHPDHLESQTAQWAGFIVRASASDGLSTALIGAFRDCVAYMDAHSDLWSDPSEMVSAGTHFVAVAAKSDSDELRTSVSATVQVLNEIAVQIAANAHVIGRTAQWIGGVEWRKAGDTGTPSSGVRVLYVVDRMAALRPSSLSEVASGDRDWQLFIVFLRTSDSQELEIGELVDGAEIGARVGVMDVALLSRSSARVDVSRLPLWIVLDSKDQIVHLAAGISRYKLGRVMNAVHRMAACEPAE